MNKVTSILESMNLDPFKYFDDSDSLFSESGELFLEEALKEATSGTTKKNVFIRLWEFIKKCFTWLAKQWSRFINWAKRTFFNKPNAKTADQIISETLGNSENATSSNTTSSSTSSQSVDKTSGSNKIQSIKVEIPVSSRSETPPEPSVDVIVKPILLSYDAAKKQFGISINDARDRGYGKVKGQAVVRNSYANIIALAERPDVFNILNEAVSCIHDNTVSEDFISKMREFWNAFDFNVNNDYVCGLDKLNDLGKNLNNLMEAINNINMSSDVQFTDSRVISEFNELANFCANLQMSMNSFTRVIQEVHTIDAKYIGSIKDTNTLDKFVKAMIDAAIPPKYIGYNTYLASDPSLKGDKGSEEKPIWGQSRLVLFPTSDNQSIIKVALSGWGLQSNRSEYDISNKIVQNGGSEFIAVTKSIGSTGATVTSERVDTPDDITPMNKINTFVRAIDKFINDHKLPFRIDDIHGKNVGYKNGKVVALDYAWSARRDPTVDISR